MGTKYQGNKERLVSSAYLYKSLMQLDAKRDKLLQDGLNEELYIYTVDHYEVCTSSDDGALLIVDNSSTPSDGEIKLSDVNPIEPNGSVVNVGSYVKFIASQKTDETKFVKRNEIDVDTVSKLNIIEETLDDGSKKQYLGFNNEKIETEIQTDDAPTKDSDKFVNSGAVYSSLFTTKQRTVIDTPENYVRCQSSDQDAILVDSTNIDAIKAFIGDITDGEYVQHIDEQSHTEDYEDNLYRLKDDSYSSTEVDEKIKEVNDRITEVASGGLKPLEMATYRTFFDNLVITADGYIEPQP